MAQNDEIFKHIELFVGSIGVILSLFFGMFLLITRKQQPKANIFLSMYLLAFSLRIGKSLFFNYFPIDPVIRNVFLGVLLAIGPSLWHYSYLMKNSMNVLPKNKYAWHYIPMALFIFFCWLLPNDGSTASLTLYYCLIAHMLTYTIYTVYWLFTNKTVHNNDTQNLTNKWLNFFAYTTLSILLFIVLITTRIIPYYMGMAFLFSVVVLCFAVWALKNPFLFQVETVKYATSGLVQQESKVYMMALETLMEDEKSYLNPDLTLSKLSKKIGISSKQLSQVINQAEGINYSQYIIRLRVSEVQRRLRSQEFKHYKIAAIAYDSGFNSISTFNTAFKKQTHQTAFEYRQSS
ncbi:MAG: AraC-like DNA-binding protein [Maribacter sp.]|jgi:AraC-like DNA-binding protein